MTSMILFSLLSLIATFLIVRNYERIDRAELASYVTIMVWAAFLFGITAARAAGPVVTAGLVR